MAFFGFGFNSRISSASSVRPPRHTPAPAGRRGKAQRLLRFLFLKTLKGGEKRFFSICGRNIERAAAGCCCCALPWRCTGARQRRTSAVLAPQLARVVMDRGHPHFAGGSLLCPRSYRRPSVGRAVRARSCRSELDAGCKSGVPWGRDAASRAAAIFELSPPPRRRAVPGMPSSRPSQHHQK